MYDPRLSLPVAPADAIAAPLWVMSIYIFFFGAVGSLDYIVINTPVPGWLNQLGGITSLVMAGFMVHGIALMFGKDSPIRFSMPASLRNHVESADKAASYLPQT